MDANEINMYIHFLPNLKMSRKTRNTNPKELRERKKTLFSTKTASNCKL